LPVPVIKKSLRRPLDRLGFFAVVVLFEGLALQGI